MNYKKFIAKKNGHAVRRISNLHACSFLDMAITEKATSDVTFKFL